MSLAGFGDILFQIPSDDDMGGDLEYLSRIANGELPGNAVLKTFENNNNGTSVIGTVPAGKDWYLLGWASSFDSSNSIIKLEYPTGTIVDSTRGHLDNALIYHGTAKGFKITFGENVSISKINGIENITILFVLEIDTGVSPKLI